MIVQFFYWTRRLQKPEALVSWQRQPGSEFDVRLIAKGLEGAMCGFLLSSLFYNQIYIHWFWSLLILAYLLHHLVYPGPTPVPRGRARQQAVPASPRQQAVPASPRRRRG